MRRLRNGLLILALLVSLGLAMLLGTNTGFRVLLAAANAGGAVSISVDSSTGSLARGLQVEGLHVATPGFSLDVADTALDMAMLPLFYGRLEIARLHLNGVSTRLKPAPATPQEGGAAALPLTVAVGDLDISHVEVVTTEDRRFRLDHVSLALEADADEFSFSRLSLYSESAAVHGDGRFRYRPPLQADAGLTWTVEQGATLPALSGETRIRGRGDELSVDTDLARPLTATLHLVLTQIRQEPRWRAELDTRPFNPHDIRDDLPDLRLAATAQAGGSLSRLAAKGRVVLSALELPGVEIAERDGDGGLTLGFDASASREGGQFTLDGEVDWQPLAAALPQQELRLTLPAGNLAVSLENKQLNLRTRTPITVNGHNGNLALAASGGPDGIRLQGLDIALEEGSLHAEGGFGTPADSGAVRLDARWQNLKLPVGGRVLHSPQGRLSLDGRLDDYRLTAQGRLLSAGLPETGLQLEATGNREHLLLQPLTLTLLDGSATATGRIRWSKPAGLELDWRGRGLNPGRQWPDWPGQLALDGHVQAARGDDGYRIDVSGLRVRGRLRQQPLTLVLDGGLRGDSIMLQRARLASGEAFMQAEGRLNRTDSDLRWQVDVPNLGAFLPDAAGSIRGSGQYRGKPATPVIAGDLEATNVQSRWLNLADMDTKLDIDLDKAGRINVDTQMHGLARGDLRLKELQLQVEGSGASHRYRLVADNDGTRIKLAGEGRYGAAAQRWQGRTEELTISDRRLGTWQLQQPFQTGIAADQMETRAVCLHHDQAGACLEGSWRPGGNWQAGVRLNAIPVTLGKAWFPYFMDAGGAFDLDLSLAAHDGRPSGNGTLRLAPGHVEFRIDEDETQRFDLNGGGAEVSVKGGRLAGQAHLDIAGLSTPVQTDITLTGLENWTPDPAQVKLQGRLTGRVDDLEFIAAMTPYVTDTRGSIRIDLNGSGTLAKPEIAGDFRLSDAGFHAPDLGVETRRMNITGTTTEAGEYRFRGEWYSGGGIARIDARLDEAPGGGVALKANVTGDNTEIINLPEIQAQATPDLEVAFSPQSKSVRGDILINKAVIDLDEMTSKTPVSEDVVIVDGNGEQARKPAQKLLTDLDIRFGDAIQIRGKGIKGNLGGELSIRNNDQGDLIGSGEVNINNGSFSAYGQSLTIEEGRLIYHQSKLDNPEVRIRAVRQVEDITAGIRVSGYLVNPAVNMFSVPAMNQEQILSYIVFGRPLSSLSSGEGADLMGAATSMGLQNSGFLTNSLANTFGLDTLRVKTEPGAGTQDASLIIGKYLTPSLYLSYGVGLFETINTATIRYDISKHWAVEAQQGSEMGADILYKLEK